MKDKYNNFEIGFDSHDEKIEWFEKIHKSFPEITIDIFSTICESIIDIDKTIKGRFGGEVKDLVAVASSRYITTNRFTNLPLTNLAHVEIGTLFGGTAILTDYILKLCNENNKFKNIMIDPLCGYYDNPIDFVSGLEVTPVGLMKNLKIFNVENYEMIEKYSTDEEAIEEIKKMNVASIFIDGDHSFAGLLKDWNNYNEFVLEGGHIIIDNVNDKNWPNINIFIQFLKSKLESQWEVVYEENITIILEKKSKNNLQIDTDFSIEIIHQIERQVDEKFYRMINGRNNLIREFEKRIVTKDKDTVKYKTMVENRDKDIVKYKTMVENRDKDIVKYKTMVENRDKKIQTIYELLSSIDMNKFTHIFRYKNILLKIKQLID